MIFISKGTSKNEIKVFLEAETPRVYAFTKLFDNKLLPEASDLYSVLMNTQIFFKRLNRKLERLKERWLLKP